ncbi:3-hydroxy-3-methylglutaryl-coenzyme A reductase [Advenella incenata]|jgi:hydroxymethylglutaryl-CoA reductase|uniref:3-hydroxy-3-methylglutaryl coenzyme A reductase n=1 Tax=Advenella incenata TaxID=267800 RepID=A0A4Q7VSE6_9BURK|nr:hydroxymethylglutaryl-CoA reductase, degradative [Advenella incenata]RZT99264.1 3-hydroxy-3-methylglutaryl-coenzyme A reductase [Advenella incenata]
MPELSSRIAGFHKLGIQGRLDILKERCNLDPETVQAMLNTGNLPADTADHLIENVITTMNIPVGIATNMKVDDSDVLVPMATEESSVVAAVCNAARQCYDNGGFTTSMSGSQMIAQIQLVNITNPQFCRISILEQKAQIKKLCDDCDPILLSLGGGLQDIEVRIIDSSIGPMVITHLIVDTRDAMGANAVNTMAEKLAPLIEQWTGGKVYLRILSNLADRRLARARATFTCDAIGGEAIRDGIMSAYHFAESDPYRAATHNKGIMNGVSAVVLATGNDTRAVEAGAHAYAARNGHYSSLTHWEINKTGDLVGSIEIPMAVGLVGGATKLHPMAKANLQILGVKSASQLARIIAATGLAQNFAALKALATTGIQKGHMALHAQNVAMMAGAVGQQIDQVANALIAQGTIRIDVAQSILQDLKTG